MTNLLYAEGETKIQEVEGEEARRGGEGRGEEGKKRCVVMCVGVLRVCCTNFVLNSFAEFVLACSERFFFFSCFPVLP